jgi:hypothetical protein
MSLLACLTFWSGLFYPNPAETPMLNFTALQWLEIMGVGVILAIIAAALRSKLWRLALPVALIMFFLVLYAVYVTGT